AGVDQVRVFAAVKRERSNPEHAVFTLQNDVDARRNVVRNQRRHANAEVHVETVAEFLGDALDDALAFFDILRNLRWSGHRSTSDAPDRATRFSGNLKR